MRVLMCPPHHYAIRYEINPWMNVSNGIHTARARAQWNGLHKTLKRLGVKVDLVKPEKNLPDMVFTANAGVVKGKTFIPSHFRYPERQPEYHAFVRYFRDRGYRIRDTAKGLNFEGEGDLLPHGKYMFGGYYFRSKLSAHRKVSQVLGKKLIPLKLVNSHFYHLDTCFFPLDDKTVLYYPLAFNEKGQAAIRKYVAHPVAIPKADADQFACNALRVGNKVVVNRVGVAFKNKLKALGYQAVETPTSEFVKAGGSVKCLLLIL